MKKYLVALMILVILCLSGCQNSDSKVVGNVGQLSASDFPSESPIVSQSALTSKPDVNLFRKKGSIVSLGHYEQDNDMNNGPDPIDWIVLDVMDDKALLLSKYALNAMPFSDKAKPCSWTNSIIRSWLNNDFINAAFSENERAAVVLSDLDNSVYQGDVFEGFPLFKDSTQDYLFLLSVAECEQYLPEKNSRKCATTPYAVANGASDNNDIKTDDGLATCSWWLRISYSGLDTGILVMMNGEFMGAVPVIEKHYLIRPAFWIDLNAEIFK